MTNIESLLDSWKKKNLTPGEKIKFLELLEKKEGEAQFRKLWEEKWEDDPKEVNAQSDIEKRLEEIRSEIKGQIRLEKHLTRSRRLRIIASVAAGIAAIAIGSWLFLRADQEVHESDELFAESKIIEAGVEKGGRPQRFTLPDSSVVWLNVDTKLRYPNAFSDSLRQVQVEGEAYFEVMEDKGRPFVVSFGNLETRVLGTTFYISSYPGTPASVILASGSIQVSEEGGQQVILEPDQKLVAVSSQKSWQVSEVSAAEMGKWKEGLLDYAQIPLGTLAPRLERWYNKPIIFDSPDTKGCWIQGKPTNKSIWDLLESFRAIHGISYGVDKEGRIHLNGGNCQ